MNQTGGLPYGPYTPAIRRFLVRLAGLGTSDRTSVAARHESVAQSTAFVRADTVLAATVERSGRGEARDALSGPLLQLLRRNEAPTDHASSEGADADDPLIGMDVIAEAAVSAVLALLVRDLIDDVTFDTLYTAFADVLPVGEL